MFPYCSCWEVALIFSAMKLKCIYKLHLLVLIIYAHAGSVPEFKNERLSILHFYPAALLQKE